MCLGYLVYRVVTAGWSTMRVCGLLVCGTWFVMACVDLMSGNRLLDWMYDEE